jgi:hypothetical protein
MFAILLAAASLAISVSAFADVQDFTVRNKGRVTIQNIYISPDYSNSWEEDVLGDDVLVAGSQMPIHMKGYGSHCGFDIKIVDVNGRSREYRHVDLCRVTYIDYP